MRAVVWVGRWRQSALQQLLPAPTRASSSPGAASRRPSWTGCCASSGTTRTAGASSEHACIAAFFTVIQTMGYAACVGTDLRRGLKGQYQRPLSSAHAQSWVHSGLTPSPSCSRAGAVREVKAAARAELATRDGCARELAAERNAALALAQQHAGQAQVRSQAQAHQLPRVPSWYCHIIIESCGREGTLANYDAHVNA